MKNGKLIVFSAPSGSGKTTILRAILEKNIFNFEFSVSASSREKREGEIHGKDYYFLSVEEFQKKIEANEFVEWEEVYTNQFYGTLRSEINRIWKNNNHVVFDIDVAGGMNLKQQFENDCFTIFIMPPSIEELEKRLQKRGTETKESIQKRISKAEFEMSFSNKFDTIVINDDLELAIQETIKKIREYLERTY
jgi:guanylate kinase